ncbi:MmgE/PrpD family protein [Bordetella sp. BOR01]|uniref:MmgE/PrpD family protein n=1 Tax=Bordetella sp. BOR01 TaxID=2854779 RepID=UPI001C47A407|nr:MmgE/PrpD family protein [Bordetella sp. BOR01]MBV7483840.1 MmgE/PrpD family protein [Bordetella sp. BOR01]
MASLTQAVADYAIGRMTVPPNIADIVKFGFIDCTACIVAGRHSVAVAATRRFLQESGRRSTVPVRALSNGVPRAPADVALLDGTSAHVLDYDDVALASHPSAVMVPAILAVAQTRPGCSGLDVLRAYVVGYEVWAELYGRDQDALHQKGWHPSSTLGLIAATAAVINVLGLSSDIARHAVGIACSRASGVTANFGSGTKPLHIGLAASEAIMATQLAQAGITAAGDALEHRSGLLHALSPARRVNVDAGVKLSDGSHYLARSGLAIKRYPVCYASHRALDGILELTTLPDFELRKIDRIRVRIGDTQANMLRVDIPQTEMQAKFALKFCLAVAAVKKRFGLAELNPRLIDDPDVAHVFSLIEVTEDQAKCDIYPWFAPADTVTVQLMDGRTLSSGPVRFAKGNAHNPIDAGELLGKYNDCMAGQDVIAAASLYDGLSTLETVDDIGGLLRSVIVPPSAS